MRRSFDHNATTPLCEPARSRMASLLSTGMGNPSSIHASGRAARHVVETARAQVAALIAAPTDAVVLGSGGSEAIALGMLGLARRSQKRRVLVGASEHPAVHGAAAALATLGFSVETWPVDRAGRIVPDAMRLDDVALVAVQAANHETGVLQPIAELVARGLPILCDAVQAAGKVPLSLDGVSALCISSHKIYGPTGAGALVLAKDVDVTPFVASGPQERGRRGGTENALALAGFGAAAEEASRLLDDAGRQRALRDELERGLDELGAIIFGADHERVPNTTLCAFAGVRGQLLVMSLDLAGFEASTGAACSSGSVKPSAVLVAAGHDEETARRAVRFSIGRDTTSADIEALLDVLPSLLTRIRR